MRLTAKEALTNPWFVDEGPVLLPAGYPPDPVNTSVNYSCDLEGKDLRTILAGLVQAQEQLVADTMEPRDEWD